MQQRHHVMRESIKTAEIVFFLLNSSQEKHGKRRVVYWHLPSISTYSTPTRTFTTEMPTSWRSSGTRSSRRPMPAKPTSCLFSNAAHSTSFAVRMENSQRPFISDDSEILNRLIFIQKLQWESASTPKWITIRNISKLLKGNWSIKKRLCSPFLDSNDLIVFF